MYATLKTIAIPARKNGIRSLITDSIEHLAILHEINNVVPKEDLYYPLLQNQYH